MALSSYADPPSLAELTVAVPAAHVDELTRSIQRHPGVVAVVHQPSAGRIVVRYDERRSAGLYLQGALLDHLSALRAPPVKRRRPTVVTVVHESVGRVRLKIKAPPL